MFPRHLTMVVLVCSLVVCKLTYGSFIKPNSVPRVGRSNEAEMPYMEGGDDDDLMGYVIKTNKNIPRMGRRNYDSENRFDIPKFYRFPTENEMYAEGSPKQVENYY